MYGNKKFELFASICRQTKRKIKKKKKKIILMLLEMGMGSLGKLYEAQLVIVFQFRDALMPAYLN